MIVSLPLSPGIRDPLLDWIVGLLERLVSQGSVEYFIAQKLFEFHGGVDAGHTRESRRLYFYGTISGYCYNYFFDIHQSAHLTKPYVHESIVLVRFTRVKPCSGIVDFVTPTPYKCESSFGEWSIRAPGIASSDK